MNDVLYSGLTALNAASSGQGETDNLGSVARVRRECLLAADLNAAFGAGRLDLARALLIGSPRSRQFGGEAVEVWEAGRAAGLAFGSRRRRRRRR
jgi:hypothetical protein